MERKVFNQIHGREEMFFLFDKCKSWVLKHFIFLFLFSHWSEWVIQDPGLKTTHPFSLSLTDIIPFLELLTIATPNQANLLLTVHQLIICPDPMLASNPAFAGSDHCLAAPLPGAAGTDWIWSERGELLSRPAGARTAISQTILTATPFRLKIKGNVRNYKFHSWENLNNFLSEFPSCAPQAATRSLELPGGLISPDNNTTSNDKRIRSCKKFILISNLI